MPVILYTLSSWRKRVKPLRNYKIGMVMLFFLAKCISPVHVISTKRNSKFLSIMFTLALGEVFEAFVDFDDDLTMGKESYSKYLNLA